MNALVIILIIISTTKLCSGQNNVSSQWEYYNKLAEEANKEDPNSSYRIIDIDSLNNMIFKHGKAQMRIDTLSNWKILFEYSYGWMHIAGQEMFNTNLIPDSLLAIKTPKKNIKYAYDNSKEYSGAALYKGLEIESAFLNIRSSDIFHHYDSLKKFPVIYERNDPLNRVWAPIISGNYLMLRYVHSYPNGNVTSFYNETILYFKRKNYKP